jgi:hypothetical protein
VQAALDKGRDLPAWYLDEPQLNEGDDFLIQAFWLLLTEAPMTEGVGFIPWSKCVAYGERAGLTTDVIDKLFIPIMQQMNDVYAKWQLDALKKQRDRMMSEMKERQAKAGHKVRRRK